MLNKRKAKRTSTSRQTVPDLTSVKGFGTEMPPDKRIVEIYFDQKGEPSEAEAFYDHYVKPTGSAPGEYLTEIGRNWRATGYSTTSKIKN